MRRGCRRLEGGADGADAAHDAAVPHEGELDGRADVAAEAPAHVDLAQLTDVHAVDHQELVALAHAGVIGGEAGRRLADADRARVVVAHEHGADRADGRFAARGARQHGDERHDRGASEQDGGDDAARGHEAEATTTPGCALAGAVMCSPP